MGSQVRRVGAVIALVMGLAACGREEAKAPEAASTEKVATAPPTIVSAAGQAPTEAERYLLGQGVKIPMAFQSASGLKAIVADNGSERKLMYVTPDGKHLILGMVYDTAGNNLTNDDMNRSSVRPSEAAAPSLSATDKIELWDAAGKLDYIEEGRGDRVVYAVFDPTCPYCHTLYQETRKFAAEGNARIRWIPVAILSESSKGLAAALYGTRDRAAGMTALMDGSASPIKVEKPAALALAKNLLFLRDTGHTGVPLVLYRGAEGVQMVAEVPSEAQYAQMFGG
ncbi:MAG: thiol:disulfide interchange protein DsbG [Luteimonas sp.]